MNLSTNKMDGAAPATGKRGFESPALSAVAALLRFSTVETPIAATGSSGKLLVLISIVALAFGIAQATPQPCQFPVFETGKTFHTGANPWAIAAGDVNNDGKLDVLTTNFDGSSLSTLLGVGDGSFQAKIDSTANTRPTGIRLADLNGDGKLDAIVTNASGVDKITVQLGDGLGNFPITATYSIYNPLTIQVVDVNNDGKMDLIVIAGDGYVGKIAVYIGTGTGTFNPPTIYSLTNGASGTLETGNFDRDGNVDLIYSNSFGIYVWKGDGNGGFAGSWAWSQNSGGISLGNFNGDQLIDFAMLDGTFKRMWIFTGNGDGTFTRQPSFPVGDIGGQGPAVDINGDGRDDLTAVNWSSNEFSVLLARGDGTFYPAVRYTTSPEPRGILFGDFNGDGKVDLVNASGKEILGFLREDHIRLTLGRGDGTFIAPTNYPTFTDSFPNVGAIADLNGDGKDDVILGNSQSFGLSVFLRTGPFRFAERRDFLPQIYIRDLAVRDLNHDGKPDLVGVGGGSVYVALGDGSGGLVFANSFQLQPGYDGSFALTMVAGDFDHDNNPDIVVGTRYGDGHLFYVKGAGNGTFRPPIQYQTTMDPILDIAAADLNGDSYTDLVVVYDTFLSLTSRVEIWMNNGSGQFVQGAQYVIGFSEHPGAVATGDFDSDGNIDFAVTIDYNSGTPAYVKTFNGNGDGTFTSATRFNVPGWQPRDILALDLNSDGKTDLLTTNSSSEDVSVFSGNGQGVFGFEQSVSAADQSQKMAAGNLNSDLSPDLIVTNYNGSSFTIMPNGCNRAVDPRIVSPFDYDGDGRTDVSVYRASSGDWYLQRSTSGFAAYHFGAPSDIPVPADLTGDGRTDVAVFRPSAATWYVLRSEDNTFYGVEFGSSGDVPIPADYTGDGKSDVAVWRPSNGAWYVRKSEDLSVYAVQFGLPSDLPALGDYDGDGKSDISVYRPSTGVWYRLNSSNGGFFAVHFGTSTDKIIPADYTGDGKTDVAVWRPSNGTWYVLKSEDLSFYGVQFGLPSDLPAPGDYDGDGKADPAVFRPSDGNWYLLQSTAGFNALHFGATADKPTPGAFVY